MANKKKKLTPAQKAAKKKRKQEYMTIFVNGKQKRVKRPPTIAGMTARSHPGRYAARTRAAASFQKRLG